MKCESCVESRGPGRISRTSRLNFEFLLALSGMLHALLSVVPTLTCRKIRGITVRNQFFSANLLHNWQWRNCVMGKKLPILKFYLNTNQGKFTIND